MAPEGDAKPISEADADAANELIDQLLEDGFTYDGVGRVTGLAAHAATTGDDDEGGDGQEDDGDAGGGEDAGGAGADAGGDAGDGSAGDAGTGDAGGVGDDGGDDDRAPAARPAADDEPELLGTRLSQTEAAGLLQIRGLLRQHPELVPKFNELIEAKLAGKDPKVETKEPEPAPLPDFIDADDPTAVGLWREVEQLRTKHEDAEGRAQEATGRADAARVRADIEAGVERFRALHPHLDETDIKTIREYTQVNVNVPGVMAGYPNDPIEGIAHALEIGSMTDPSVRDKVLGTADAARQQQDGKDRQRKRNLGALSGSSGSSKRATPAPKKPASWNEAAAALAKELEAMGGSA